MQIVLLLLTGGSQKSLPSTSAMTNLQRESDTIYMPLSCGYKKKQIQTCLLKVMNIESRTLGGHAFYIFSTLKG